jgi:hypothetical protein
MSYCYLCGTSVQDKDKSEEHIIPNAIGGRIKSDRILCEIHNNQLGTINDAKFVSIFSHISKLANVKTERKVSEYFYGIHSQLGLEVQITRDEIVPKRLTFDEKTLTVYAPNNKLIDNYKKKLLSDGYVLSDITFITTFVEDEIEIFSGFNNEVFKMGFAKIAANFATENGVISKDLKFLIQDRSFKAELPVIPYIPDTTEVLKGNEDSSEHYPFHVIALHSDQNNYLYCYVELFSKFKHIVLLTDNYIGPEIHSFYIYSIEKGIELDISAYIDLYPQYARFKTSLNLCKYYKAKQIPDYLSEVERIISNSDLVQSLYALDSLKSNEYIEKYVDNNLSINSKF